MRRNSQMLALRICATFKSTFPASVNIGMGSPQKAEESSPMETLKNNMYLYLSRAALSNMVATSQMWILSS